jgi:outer membrane lipoprotein-sorting protein
MTRCAFAECRLRALVDGELDAGESRKVLAHVDQCSACRQAYQRVQSVASLLQEQELEDVPDHFSADLQVRLARHRREREAAAARRPLFSWPFTLPRPIRTWQLAAGAMTAVVTLSCLFAFTRVEAADVVRKAGEKWSLIQSYGCVFTSRGVYQGQQREFDQKQFYRKPGEFRLETRKDYPLTTFVSKDQVIHHIPGATWKGKGPVVIIRPRRDAQDAVPFPFGVTWHNGGNVSLDQLVRQLGENAARMMGEEKVGGRDCYRLGFNSVPPGGSRQDQYEMWIDKENFLPRRVSWYRDPDNHIVTEAQSLQVNYTIVPDDTFDFAIPRGAVVIRGDIDPHVMALPRRPVDGLDLADYRVDPIGSAEAEGWDRTQDVPFPVSSPEWLPNGFELVRVRRKMGRWVEMYWIRQAAAGEYQMMKLVEQDASVELKEDLSDADEVNVGTEERPVRAKLSQRRAPYAHVYMSWRQGGTRFILTAAELDADDAVRVAASMALVSEQVRRTSVARHGEEDNAGHSGEPSQLPTDASTMPSDEARASVPQPEAGPAPEEQLDGEQPPMMPEMSDDDMAGVR